MTENCFCHIRDKKTGEVYVVKDKEARKKIDNLEERIDNLIKFSVFLKLS